MEYQTSKTQKKSCTSETREPRPYGQGRRFLFHSDLARMTLTLHRDLHHAHADTNMSKRNPRRYRRFLLFLVLPSPQKGAGWGRGAQQQQQKSAAATAAAARARENEINTAKREKIGFAPADLLYSESLTKSTKSNKAKAKVLVKFVLMKHNPRESH